MSDEPPGRERLPHNQILTKRIQKQKKQGSAEWRSHKNLHFRRSTEELRLRERSHEFRDGLLV